MRSIKKPIVIVGAGFGGLTVASNLKRLNPSLPVKVVDFEDKFILKPLMYEILSKESIFDMGNYHLSTPNVNFAFKNAQKFTMQNQYKKFIKIFEEQIK